MPRTKSEKPLMSVASTAHANEQMAMPKIGGNASSQRSYFGDSIQPAFLVAAASMSAGHLRDKALRRLDLVVRESRLAPYILGHRIHRGRIAGDDLQRVVRERYSFRHF